MKRNGLTKIACATCGTYLAWTAEDTDDVAGFRGVLIRRGWELNGKPGEEKVLCPQHSSEVQR